MPFGVPNLIVISENDKIPFLICVTDAGLFCSFVWSWHFIILLKFLLIQSLK